MVKFDVCKAKTSQNARCRSSPEIYPSFSFPRASSPPFRCICIRENLKLPLAQLRTERRENPGKTNEDMHNSAYIKTWVGALVPQSSYESNYQPRGAGWSSIRNILFANFHIQGADSKPAITEDSGNNGSYSGTSLMKISNIAFVNFTGYLNNKSATASVSCSKVHPCYNSNLRMST